MTFTRCFLTKDVTQLKLLWVVMALRHLGLQSRMRDPDQQRWLARDLVPQGTNDFFFYAGSGACVIYGCTNPLLATTTNLQHLTMPPVKPQVVCRLRRSFSMQLR